MKVKTDRKEKFIWQRILRKKQPYECIEPEDFTCIKRQHFHLNISAFKICWSETNQDIPLKKTFACQNFIFLNIT